MRSSTHKSWVFGGVVAAASLLACYGEMSSLSGSPCDTDLDCPGAYTCKALGIDGHRTCQSLTRAEEELPPGELPPAGTPYYCAEVKPLLDQYCNSCHGSNRTPSGIQYMRFDQWHDDADGTMGAKASSVRIRVRTFDFKDMPPAAFPMKPTDAEREIIKRWEAAGAPNCEDNPFPASSSGGGTDAGTGTGGGSGMDGGTTTTPPGMDAGTAPQPVSYAQDIQPIWNTYCNSCHRVGDQRGQLNLDANVSYTQLINSPSVCNAGVDLVEPGNPQNSMLWRKIFADPSRCNGVMPTGNHLAAFDMEAAKTIERWISEGAQNN